MIRNYYSRYETALVPAEEKPIQKGNGLSGIIGNIFSNIAIDDLILLAVILILITDEQPDIITILALVYIFLV